MRRPSKELPSAWKGHFQAFLLDAAVMMVGAWLFLLIGHIILRIIATFLR